MGLFDRLMASMGADLAPAPKAAAQVQAFDTTDIGDPALAEFMRGGSNAAGARLNRHTALRNASVWRCINLISNSIAMLPLHLMREDEAGAKDKASDHPLFDVLYARPNGWQTAFEFRRLMQHRVLTEGNAYALVVRGSRGVAQLVPLAPDTVKPEQRDDWSVVYKVRGKSGGEQTYTSEQVFHLRGPSEDGIKGLALTDYAADVLGLSLRAQEAAARVFAQGNMAGGALYTDQKLSPEARENLRRSLEEKHSGAENVGKSMVLEQGLKYQAIASTAKDAQHLETRQHQIEEIARIFGVPRPFLMVDDTSWGSGIEQLGIFFVQYGLAPWFVVWEQAILRTLLTEQERRTLYPKFNERALLRGSMKDQGEYLSKLMGSGGSPQIAEQNEARAWLDLPEHVDGYGLSKGSQGGANAPQPAA